MVVLGKPPLWVGGLYIQTVVVEYLSMLTTKGNFIARRKCSPGDIENNVHSQCLYECLCK